MQPWRGGKKIIESFPATTTFTCCSLNAFSFSCSSLIASRSIIQRLMQKAMRGKELSALAFTRWFSVFFLLLVRKQEFFCVQKNRYRLLPCNAWMATRALVLAGITLASKKGNSCWAKYDRNTSISKMSAPSCRTARLARSTSRRTPLQSPSRWSCKEGH